MVAWKMLDGAALLQQAQQNQSSSCVEGQQRVFYACMHVCVCVCSFVCVCVCVRACVENRHSMEL